MMMRLIRAVPIPMAGLALAFAALGNLLLKLPHGFAYGEIIRYGCGVMSFALLTLVILKLVLDWPHASAEFKTPVPLSVLPTATMTLMLLCTYVKPHVGDIIIYVWYAAVALHVAIMLLFIVRFVFKFKLEHAFPSWFIAAVGIVTASVTAPAMSMPDTNVLTTNALLVGQTTWYLGLTLYVLTLPTVIWRLAKKPAMMEPLTLTFVIFTAPLSLLLVGYLGSFAQQLNATVVYALLVGAVIKYVIVSVRMISMLRVRFYPTYAAFTFPFVISAIAFRQANAFLVVQGYTFFWPIAMLSIVIAIAIVLYVLVRYIGYFRYYLSFSK